MRAVKWIELLLRNNSNNHDFCQVMKQTNDKRTNLTNLAYASFLFPFSNLLHVSLLLDADLLINL